MRGLQVDDKIIQPRQVLGRISQAKNRLEAPDKVGNGTYRDEQSPRSTTATSRPWRRRPPSTSTTCC